MSKLKFEELEFILRVPDTLDGFRELISGRTTEQQLIIIQRIRKSNHTKLGGENKNEIQRFLLLILSYFKELCEAEVINFQEVDVMSRAVFALSHDIPDIAAGVAK